MAVNGRTYPVDGLLAVYNLLMAAVWLAHAGGWDHAPMLGVAHGAAALLPALLRRSATLSRPGRALRDLYPLLFLLAFWAEVDLIRRMLHAGANDAFVLALDEAVLGVHLHEVWMPSMHTLWFSELLHFSYFAYYLAVALPVLWLAGRGRRDDLMAALFRMMATFLVCFVIYAAFPVDGPKHTGVVFEGPNGAGPFARLVERVAGGSGESLGAAFPSSHVAGAVTMAWIARLYLPRWAFRLLAVEALGVFLSTFYTQQHYAIDSVAGVLLALGIQGGLVPAALAARSRAPRPAAGLPGVPPLRPTLSLTRAGAAKEAA